MASEWVMEELQTASLGDKRLDARLREVLSQFADRPTASIPAACGGYAEMTAAYRLFDNDKVTLEKILAPHGDATRRRINSQSRVLLVQDTTEIDLTRPEQQVLGAGPLDSGSRRGALLHLLQAFAPDGTPLGTVQAQAWTRSDDPPEAAMTRSQRARRPLEEKESHRWVQMLREARQLAEEQPQVRFVCVADSEADFYELLAEATAEPGKVDWIVRACQDRRLEVPPEEAEGPVQLWAELQAQAVLFTHAIYVRGREAKTKCETRGRRQPRQSRQAELEVRAGRVKLSPPARVRPQGPAIEAQAILVREAAPPTGEEAVEWLLLTSLPIDTQEQVRQAIQDYCTRWMIEVLFRTLKSGCRVEERRLERLGRQLPCLAVYLIVAWRTLYVCRLGRSCPDVSCELLFDPAEWKAVYRVTQGQPPPAQPPKLAQMVRWVAQLGGYVPRRNQSPGPQTVWLGLQRAHDFALCWNLFGPEAQIEPRDV